jgi:hypothetical protein
MLINLFKEHEIDYIDLKVPLDRAWRLCANRCHVIRQVRLVCAQLKERKNEKDQGLNGKWMFVANVLNHIVLQTLLI